MASTAAARYFLRIFQLAVAAIVLLTVGAAGAGADDVGQPDGISPTPVSLSLGLGSSATITPTLHLNAAPPKADVILALDTTGSMGAAIDDAKHDANAIVGDIQTSIPGARFAVAEFKDYGDALTGVTDGTPWRVVQDFTDNAATVTCGGSVEFPVILSPVACALSKLTATGGGDEPEAYNTAFYEAYSDPAFHFTAGAPRFLVVLGDSLPHDATLNTDFPSCPNTPPTDPGPTGVGVLRTQPTLAALKARNMNVSFVTYNPRAWDGGPFQLGDCQASLAAYTGGNAVTHATGTASLETQIVSLINQAASHIDGVAFTVTGTGPAGAPFTPSSWVSFNPPQPYGPISAPADVTYDETVTVPQDAQVGAYTLDVHAVADGAERAVQHITVNVQNKSVSTLTMTSDESTVPAGITAAPFSSIPASRLPLLSPDVQSAPAGSIPAGSIPAGSIPAGSIPAGSIPAGSIGLGVSPAGSIPAGSIPAGSIALKSVLLSQIPLAGTTWADVLKDSPFATQPLQAVTLEDVANYSTRSPVPPAGDGKTPWERLMALPVKNVPFLTTLWRNVPFAALMVGNAPIGRLPTPAKPDGTPYSSWAAALDANGGNSTAVQTTTNTVFGVAIAGDLGSTPAGSIPAGSIDYGSFPAGSIPAGSIPAGSINIGATSLRSVLVSDITPLPGKSLADYVNCSGSFACPAGSTLGSAYTAGAINPSLTLGTLFQSIPAGSIGRQTTIDQIVQAMLPLSDYPWEQIKVQGLQDVAGTGKNVHYHVDFDLNCSITTSFLVHVKLPDGFFPVAGSSTFSYVGGSPIAASDPSSGANGLVWSTIPGNPCGGTNVTRHVRLDFVSYAGLTLGSQSSSVDVTANGTYSAVGQAPVLVTQNWEPNGDPASAPTIDKNTLVVAHIATSSDVDYFRFPLDGLAPGTKIAAFLKVPGGADLDLVLNKPGAPTIQPNPAGSIPAGSIAIEDANPGVDNSHGALPPDTLADIPAGSIPAGSIPAGSISANRGAVNESAQIVTHGETGAAVIGISGYNGAFSAGNYVLRLKVTAPPPLPPCAPVTGLAPTLATPSALPASLPANTQAIFLVNRQRLAGLYGEARMNALVNSSALSGVAGQVNGAVLPVDGSPAVKNAYAAWDSHPCSTDAANDVVRSINGVVAGYRASLPNLKYVTVLGTDQAIPMWRQQDLTSLSPEVDNAQELAFTTNNLTAGNSTYASSALNTVLTDGAYGAFTKTTFLGHDLPLAQISVSRLVETPEDILGQLQQFLTSGGKLDLHSALTTGDDFFTDGASAAGNALNTQLGLTADTLIPPTSLWTHQDLLDHFFNKSPVPDVGALYAHYSQWLAQPASVDLSANPLLPQFATTADVSTAHSDGQLLFTIGCHSGLNVPDTIASVAADDQKRLLDWPQAYSQAKAAVYVANTGFGYGDTKTIDLSERLMRNFATNLNTGGTIGEQWVRALHSYYATSGLYDVVDEKVMIEANMYGLPFYGYTNPGTALSPPAPPSVHSDGGVDTASLPTITGNETAHDVGGGQKLFYDDAHPDGTTYTDANGVRLTAGTLNVFYRPAQPQLSRDVTVPGKAAHGAFITSLTTHTATGIKPYKPHPLVDSTQHEPDPSFPNIFFPAGVVTVNRDVTFGTEHDTAVVNMGRFRPDASGDLGTEQAVDSIGLDIGYSNSSDSTMPQITQTGAIQTGPTSFTAFVRVTDDSGALHRVAVIYNNGGTVWQVAPLQPAGGDLWTANLTTSGPIFLDAEAQDFAGNVGYSFNKAVNFQSTVDQTKPATSVDQPLPNTVYMLNQQVRARFDCSDAGAVASCSGSSDGGPSIPSGGLLDTTTPGQHTFTVTATDLAGNSTTTQTIPYVVRFVFSGFRPPVDNPPVLNIVKAGSTAPVKWGLNDTAGVPYANLNAVQSISSKAIKCPSAVTDPISTVLPIGLSGLKITGTDFNFNWSTDKAWAGTCRRLFIHFSDLTTPYADFQFK